MGAGYAPGRLGEAWPPSSVSLAEGARRPRAVLALVVGGVMVNMATVPRRTGHAYFVRRIVPGVLRDSGVAGFTVATPRHIAIMWMQTSRIRS